MKSTTRTAFHSLYLSALPALLLSGPLMADEPTITINSPSTGETIFCPSFPCPTSTPVDFHIFHEGSGSPAGRHVGQLTQLRVEVNSASILLNAGGDPVLSVNPFTNDDACSAELIDASTSCSTDEDGGITGEGKNANVVVPWTPEAVGPYTIVVSARHTSETGEDVETVEVALLNAEYPAPPAEANRFLNASPDVVKRFLNSGVRGCIISWIAEQHAKLEAYGPKGGPYDIELIESDAFALYSGACQSP